MGGHVKGALGVAMVLVLGVLAPARDADACSCGRPVPSVWPLATDVAPLDSHVWVFDPPTGLDGVARPLQLRLAGGALVATDVRPMASDEARVSELIPRAPLAPGKAYEVVHERAARGGKRGELEVLGSFKTGKAVDGQAPTLGAAGVVRTTFVRTTAKTEVVTIKGKKVIRILQSSCSRLGVGYALIDLAQGSDDLTPPGSLGYGVWPAGSKDLAVTPMIVLHPNMSAPAASPSSTSTGSSTGSSGSGSSGNAGSGGNGKVGPAVVTLQLGTDDVCDVSSYDFSGDLARVPATARGKRAPRPFLVHFIVAAIDASGKRSAPVSVAIDLANPAQSAP